LGGYYDYAAGEKNRYVVGFVGNTATHISTVREYAHRRAAQLCQEKGFKGYKIIDKSQDDSYVSTPSRTNCYGNNDKNKFNVNCSTSDAEMYKKSTVEFLVECQ
jgi:hypothetical protein